MKYLTTIPASAPTNRQGRFRRRELLKGTALTGLVAALPACGAENESPGVNTDPVGDPSNTTTVSNYTSTGPAASTTVSTSQPTNNTNVQPTTSATSATTDASTSSTNSPSPSTNTAETETAPASTSDTTEMTSEVSGDSASSGESSGLTTNGELTVPEWDDVPICQASPTDGAGQGPFFIHNDEKTDDIDLYRQDIRGQYNPDAEAGTEMHLHLRILDSTSTECNGSPVAGVEVYIWHTDAQGYYSGFGNPGDQNPDLPYAGTPNQNDLDNADRFCRGAAITDANGVVSFRSIFPGWYNGRDIHIHFVALKRGSASRGRQTYSGSEHLFTTQFYFEPALTDAVHKASEPYLRRTQLSAYQGAIQADEPGDSGLTAKASFDGGLVVAQMQIVLDPKA